eukprot:GHVN01064389.1.p1 GENE.GHVN01064389.1~~GHVN01064389.1.p1  ORF type:complete len:965 (+),score=250.97 GHVN01064389.1:136-3030(+)
MPTPMGRSDSDENASGDTHLNVNIIEPAEGTLNLSEEDALRAAHLAHSMGMGAETFRAHSETIVNYMEASDVAAAAVAAVKATIAANEIADLSGTGNLTGRCMTPHDESHSPPSEEESWRWGASKPCEPDQILKILKEDKYTRSDVEIYCEWQMATTRQHRPRDHMFETEGIFMGVFINDEDQDDNEGKERSKRFYNAVTGVFGQSKEHAIPEDVSEDGEERYLVTNDTIDVSKALSKFKGKKFEPKGRREQRGTGKPASKVFQRQRTIKVGKESFLDRLARLRQEIPEASEAMSVMLNASDNNGLTDVEQVQQLGGQLATEFSATDEGMKDVISLSDELQKKFYGPSSVQKKPMLDQWHNDHNIPISTITSLLKEWETQFALDGESAERKALQAKEGVDCNKSKTKAKDRLASASRSLSGFLSPTSKDRLASASRSMSGLLSPTSPNSPHSPHSPHSPLAGLRRSSTTHRGDAGICVVSEVIGGLRRPNPIISKGMSHKLNKEEDPPPLKKRHRRSFGAKSTFCLTLSGPGCGSSELGELAADGAEGNEVGDDGAEASEVVYQARQHMTESGGVKAGEFHRVPSFNERPKRRHTLPLTLVNVPVSQIMNLRIHELHQNTHNRIEEDNENESHGFGVSRGIVSLGSLTGDDVSQAVSSGDRVTGCDKAGVCNKILAHTSGLGPLKNLTPVLDFKTVRHTHSNSMAIANAHLSELEKRVDELSETVGITEELLASVNPDADPTDPQNMPLIDSLSTLKHRTDIASRAKHLETTEKALKVMTHQLETLMGVTLKQEAVDPEIGDDWLPEKQVEALHEEIKDVIKWTPEVDTVIERLKESSQVNEYETAVDLLTQITIQENQFTQLKSILEETMVSMKSLTEASSQHHTQLTLVKSSAYGLLDSDEVKTFASTREWGGGSSVFSAPFRAGSSFSQSPLSPSRGPQHRHLMQVPQSSLLAPSSSIKRL